MKINVFSQLLLLSLNACCIFAAEQNSKTLGKLSPLTQKMARKATEEERIRKILNDHPDAYVMLGGGKQVKITEEMMRGADIAGNVHEEWLKKNLLQNEQLSSEEDDVCCTVTLKFKW